MSIRVAGQGWVGAWALALLSALAGCGGGGGDSASSSNLPTETALSAQAQLGERIFSDVTLSASGRQSCATCHVETSGHAPDNALAAQFGGVLLDQQGSRNAPSINYLSFNTAFFFAADGTPTLSLIHI